MGYRCLHDGYFGLLPTCQRQLAVILLGSFVGLLCECVVELFCRVRELLQLLHADGDLEVGLLQLADPLFLDCLLFGLAHFSIVAGSVAFLWLLRWLSE